MFAAADIPIIPGVGVVVVVDDDDGVVVTIDVLSSEQSGL